MIRTNLLPEEYRVAGRRRRPILLPIVLIGILGVAGWKVGLSVWWEFQARQIQMTLRVDAPPGPKWTNPSVVSYGRLLRSLAVALPENDLWLLGIEDGGGGTVVRGQAREDAAVFDYLGDLRDSPEIRSAHVLRLFEDGQGRSEFLVQVDAGHRHKEAR